MSPIKSMLMEGSRKKEITNSQYWTICILIMKQYEGILRIVSV